MSTPACGAWVNLVSTCPPPQPSTPTPSVGKSKVKDRGGGTHFRRCNSSNPSRPTLLSIFIIMVYNIQNTVLCTGEQLWFI